MPQAPRAAIPVTLRLSKEAETKLTARAAAQGIPLGDYLATLVESLVETPRNLAEISGPVHQRFVDSGTTDEQLSAELEQAKHDMRADRRGRRAS